MVHSPHSDCELIKTSPVALSVTAPPTQKGEERSRGSLNGGTKKTGGACVRCIFISGTNLAA